MLCRPIGLQWLASRDSCREFSRRISAGNFGSLNPTYLVAGYPSEIRHGFCEFDAYLCAAFVRRTKTNYSAMSVRPILGILEHQALADRHTSC